MARRKRRSWRMGGGSDEAHAEARKLEPRTPSEASDSSEDLPEDSLPELGSGWYAPISSPLHSYQVARAQSVSWHTPQQPPLPLAAALVSAARQRGQLREDRLRLQEVLEEPEE